jgi:hypothetical protein
MATIVITLTDTPKGSVSVQTDFIPTVGASCTPAQSTALEIITRTKRQWGLQDAAPAMQTGEQKHV